MRGGRNRYSIRWRIAAVVSIAVLLTELTITVVAYQLQRHSVRDTFINASLTSVVADAHQLTALVQSGGVPAAEKEVNALAAQRLTLSYGLYRDGQLLPGSNCAPSLCLQTLPESVRAYTNTGQLGSDWTTPAYNPSVRALVAAQPVADTPFTLAAVFDFDLQQNYLNLLRTTLLTLDGAGVVLAIIIGLLVGTTVSRPLRAAAAAADRIGAGQLDARIPDRGGRELADLAHRFNHTVEQLSTTMQDLQAGHDQQRRFVADVSHELRTPVAALLAAATALDSPDRSSVLAAQQLLQTQTTRLHRLVEDLLELSTLDAGQACLNPEPVDLTELCRDVIDTLALPAVAVTTSGDTIVTADPRRLHTALRNLLRNAARHGTPPIHIDIQSHPVHVEARVVDHGNGIPPHIHDTLFDRFVRGDQARSGNGTSTGLGLAIAAENVHLHNGSLTLESTNPTTFLIRLPRTTATR